MNLLLRRVLVGVCVLAASPVQAQWRYADLHPANASSSSVLGVSATDQVGVVTPGFNDAGARWLGTPSSYVNYSPSGLFATDGVNRVGRSLYNGRDIASFWNGNPNAPTRLPIPRDAQWSIALALSNGSFGGATAISTGAQRATFWANANAMSIIHPSGFANSAIHAMDSNTQGGVADGRAATWNGSTSSFVDRHPAGYTASEIVGLHGSKAVGSVSLLQVAFVPPRGHTFVSVKHAGAWDLTSGNFSDRHPAQYLESTMKGVSQDWAAGDVTVTENCHHAVVWDLVNGTFTDLHNVLPSGTFQCSGATSIWRGAGTYVGGWATTPNGSHAILWYIPPT